MLGTDLTVPGHSMHREIELAVKSGLSPLDALRAGTLLSARALGLEKEIGSIEPGKRADLIVLTANPLEDPSNIRKIRWVITQGRVHDPAGLWRSAGFRPDRNND